MVEMPVAELLLLNCNSIVHDSNSHYDLFVAMLIRNIGNKPNGC